MTWIMRIGIKLPRKVAVIDNRQGWATITHMDISQKTLLIAWHSRTGASRAMAQAAAEGAGGRALILPAQDVMPDHLLGCGAYLFVCPENLASMSGMMKEMFDRCYYAVLGQIEGRAYATAIAAGSDGEGAQRQIDRIAKGWRLRRVAEPLIINCDAQTPEEILAEKSLSQEQLSECHDTGAGLAEGLVLGIF